MSLIPNDEASEPVNHVSANAKGGSGVSAAEMSGNNSNDNRRQAWNRPVSSVAERSLVMGADSWPSLAETANAPQRPASDYSSVSEGTVSLFSQVSSSRNHTAHNVRPNSHPNGSHRGRHNSTRNHSHRSSVGYSNRTQQHHSPSSQGPVSDVSPNNNSDHDAGQNNGSRSQTHSGHNHPQHRRSNNGPHPHGDSSLGRRRNLDRGAPDANSHISHNARAGPVQPPIFPGPPPKPALPVLPFQPPTPPPYPTIPFMPHGFHPGPPQFYAPMLSPMMGPLTMRPHPYFAPIELQAVVAELMKQIDYYFSEDSLVKDVYLRSNMDDQGWVSVTTIANFRKVKDITARAKKILDDRGIDTPQFILNVMQNSHFVEVQGDKLRKRSKWEKFILPSIIKSSSSSAAEAPSNQELIGRLENTVLEEKPIHSNSELKADDKATNGQSTQ